MQNVLDFERPIVELERRIEELRHMPATPEVNIGEEVTALEGKAERLLRQTYAKLTPWQKVQVARHPERPHFLDYQQALFTDFTALAGDRMFGEDRAVIGGLGRFRGHSVMLIGTEKGAEVESRIAHNFGMAKPEGYRKAQRLFELADRFHLPILTLIDTAGAYPGVEAEARGQSEAIARTIEASLKLTVPLIATIIGEGGSGGAVALATGNAVLMLEHAVYSVISPEGCASILWRSGDEAATAAESLRLTAQDLHKLRVIDTIVPEPLGGAHRDKAAAISLLGDALEDALVTVAGKTPAELKQQRRERFLAIGDTGL